jgi:hypothetical protein
MRCPTRFDSPLQARHTPVKHSSGIRRPAHPARSPKRHGLDLDGYEVLELLDAGCAGRPRAAAIIGKDQLSKENFEAILAAFSRAAATASP